MNTDIGYAMPPLYIGGIYVIRPHSGHTMFSDKEWCKKMSLRIYLTSSDGNNFTWIDLKTAGCLATNPDRPNETSFLFHGGYNNMKGFGKQAEELLKENYGKWLAHLSGKGLEVVLFARGTPGTRVA